MKTTLSFVGGTTQELTLTRDVEAELIGAMVRQDPAAIVVLDDGSRLAINTRNLASIAYTPESTDPPAEPDPSAESAEDTRKVAELKAALDGAGVQYDSKAVKADLQQLAADHNL